jgi:hypothetical protein
MRDYKDIEVAKILFLSSIAILLFLNISLFAFVDHVNSNINNINNNDMRFDIYTPPIQENINYRQEVLMPIVDKECDSIIDYTESYENYILFIVQSHYLYFISNEEAALICRAAHEVSSKYNIDFDAFLVLGAVESNFLKNAVSKAGAKYGRGIWQVSEIALADYNRVNGTNYKYSELFDVKINAEIAAWMFVYNIYYGVTNRYDDLYIAYNIGNKAWRRDAEIIKSGIKDGQNWKRVNHYLAKLDKTNILKKELAIVSEL